MKFCSCLFVLLALTIPARADEVDPTKPVIAVELKTTTPVVKKDQSPRLTVEIVNRSGREITFVKPGDGSDCGWRTPVVLWAVEGVKPGRVARCGYVNPLTPDEVFTLKPGQRTSLGGWVGMPQLPGPGTYTVRFRYENKPDLKWRGKHDEGTMARVRASTPAAAESNPVRIEVKD
jgi:hypothetical protein